MKKSFVLLLTAILILLLAACQKEPAKPDIEQPISTTAPTEPATTEPENTEPAEQAHQHSYRTTVTAPSCTTAGYTSYACDCGDSFFRDLVNATGHRYADKVVAPTATAAGYTEHSCSACGAVTKDGFVAPVDTSHRHNYVFTNRVVPSCRSIGYSVYTCSCGDSHMDDLVNATEHNYNEKVIAPTEEHQGYTEHTCTVCAAVYKDNFVDPLTPTHQHQYVLAQEIAATCIEKGYSLYSCDCGDEFYGNYTAVLGDHTFISQVVAPTHTTEGFTVHCCTVCDESYTDSYVERTPEHHYSTWFVSEPTCRYEGYTVYRCDCGSEHVDDYVPTLEHTYPTVEIIEATCMNEGYTIHRCVCGLEYKDGYTPALPHDYYLKKVIEPTYDAEGYSVYVCRGCGETHHDDFTEKLPPEPSNGHVCSGAHAEVQMGGYTYVYCDTITAPYMGEDGYTIYYPYEYYF